MPYLDLYFDLDAVGARCWDRASRRLAADAAKDLCDWDLTPEETELAAACSLRLGGTLDEVIGHWVHPGRRDRLPYLP